MEYPDGFHVLSEEEEKHVFQDDNPNRAGIWDKDRHVIVAVLWHSSNKLLIALAGNAKGVAQNNESRISRVLKDDGYKKGEFLEMQIAGNKAYGFSYEYEVQGVIQCCRTISVIEGVTCYNIYFYGRRENEETGLKLFEEILRTVQFNK